MNELRTATRSTEPYGVMKWSGVQPNICACGPGDESQIRSVIIYLSSVHLPIAHHLSVYPCPYSYLHTFHRNTDHVFEKT